MNKAVLCYFVWIVSVKSQEVCEITACDALTQSKIDLQEYIDNLEDQNTNKYLLKLERRLRSLEQPGKSVN